MIYVQDNNPVSKTERADARLAILILQIITVAVLLAFAAGIRIFGGDIYNKLSYLYHEKFDDVTLASDVLEPNKTEQNSSEDTSEISSETKEGQPKTEDSKEDIGADDPIDNTVTGYIDNSEYTDTALMTGNKINSFLWPVTGKLTSDYGFRTNPITGQYRMHGGIDIGANTGTPILCAYDGKVSDAGYSDSYGYYIIVTHNDNVQTLYAHCSEITSKKGDYVKRGESIALVGSTGRSTGAHLHFEIRIGGCRIDPRWILSDKAEAV